MKRLAYNRLITQENQTVNGPLVIVFDDNGKPAEYHQLTAEEPMTEWVGGTFDARK